VVHALAAYAHLARGHENRAVEGFEEALRLDPEDEAVQAGLAEALKAAHPLYRPIFRFYMWQGRLSRRERGALIIVPIITTHALRPLAGNPFVLGLILAWCGFVVLTWAVPVANLALRLSRRGRAVLPVEQKRSSSIFGLLIGGGLLALILGVIVTPAFAATAFALAFLALSAGSGHAVSLRKQRALGIVIGIAAAVAFAGAALVAGGVVEPGAILIVVAMLTGLALLWIVRFA
jgi:hypothetical protein